MTRHRFCAFSVTNRVIWHLQVSEQSSSFRNSLIEELPYLTMIRDQHDWWIGRVVGRQGASRHICFDHAMFKTYSTAEDKKVLLGNSHTSIVAGTGDVELKFTSRKTMILKEVMHTREMRKNLVSGYLINKAGFTQTIGLIYLL
uniref:Retrovirus-related Pol polyprotein from transposon TNT 1-94-like beta-barrel domain-containing protein n=1 Tax=Cannabis sativa TaxID=3483 RepID=A0A803NUV6_CANSA